jgi:RNA-directed DNA polymerase
MDKQRLRVRLDQHLEGLLEESYRPQPVKRIYPAFPK